MKAQRLSYSVLLPLITLVVWAVLVPTPALMNCLSLLRESHGGDPVHLYFGNFGVVVPRDRLFLFSLDHSAYQQNKLIRGINTPGLIADSLISLSSSWPENWYPAAFTSAVSWGGVAYPFYCLPWWWFVGRGFDGVTARRRIGWLSLLIGCLLSFACAFLGTGFLISESASRRVPGLWIDLGFIFWAVLFAITPMACWRQRRRLRKAVVADPPAANTNGAAEAAPSNLLNH